jgi:site-specific recombinase XerD
MKLRWQGFHGPISAPIECYLAHKRALGCRFHTEERALQLLDRFLIERGIRAMEEIEPKLVEAFLASRPRARPRSYNHLLCVVQRLFDWLVARGELACSPVQMRPRRETVRHIPFLFNAGQARRLLDAATTLPDTSNAPLRGHTYRTMFALLYGLGLRVGEVSRLCGRDLDFGRQLLVIRDTKFSKSRLVPFGPRIGHLLEDYLGRRAVHYGSCGPETLLFSFDGIKPITLTAICGTFHRLFDQLKLPIPPGVSRPRVHDLRHSFAVGTLLRWYREGIDPSTQLLHLSRTRGSGLDRGLFNHHSRTPLAGELAV